MNIDSRKKYLFKNTIIFTIGGLGTKLIAFFLVPLYTKYLSTSQFGIVDLVVTICTILVPIISFNIGEAIMRFSLDKNADYDSIMRIGWLFTGISVFLGTISIPVLSLFESLRTFGILIGLYSISLGLYQIAICNLRGKELLMQYSIVNIINTFLIAVLNIVFWVYLEMGVNGYFVSYISANLLTAILAFVLGNAFSALKIGKVDVSLLKQMVRYSFFLIPTSLMWWITNSSDRLMVSTMIGVSANGIYAVSYKLPNMISSLTAIFNQAWSYSAIREVGSKDENAYTNVVYNRLFSLMILSTGLLTVVLKPFLWVYVDRPYYSAWKYIPYLVIGSIFMTQATFLSTAYTVHKNSKGFLISGAVGAITNIILNLLLIPMLGVTGASLATCVSYLAVFVYRIIDTRKYITIEPINKLLLGSLFILIIMNGILFLPLDWIRTELLLLVMYFIIVILLRQDVLSYLVEVKKLINIKFKRN